MVLRKKMVVNGFWLSLIDLGKSIPRASTLIVLNLGYRRPLAAAVMYTYLGYMVHLEKILCFAVRLAIQTISEGFVTKQRFEVYSFR